MESIGRLAEEALINPQAYPRVMEAVMYYQDIRTAPINEPIAKNTTKKEREDTDITNDALKDITLLSEKPESVPV